MPIGVSIDMSSMFQSCSKLTSLDVSNFNTSKMTNMSIMFSGCSNLSNLDLRNATFDKVTSYNNMFLNVSTSINVITKNDTTKTWLEDKLGGKGTVTIA